jgi:hypothetical protein
MSKQAVELLNAFEALPLGDKQAFAIEVLRRTRALPFDSGSFTDEEVGDAGRSLLAYLIKQRMPPRRVEVWLFDLMNRK